MKNSIGFVCIGQAGGNIGQLLDKDYESVFINSSTEDLKTLDVKYKFHIPEGEGCNKDRDKAIMLIKKHYKKVIEFINDILSKKSTIYLVGSTGGGTASGSIPLLLDMLISTFPDKHFGCVTILPSLSELPKPQMNAYYCYQELSKIDNLASVFTLDNEKGNKFTINNTFVKLFNSVIDIPNHIDTRGNIDKAEIKTMLNKRGHSIISLCGTTNPNNLSSAIIKSWEENIFAPIEKDKRIVYMGLSLTNEINVNDLQKVIGVPYDVFYGYNQSTTVALLSGLSFPKTRIDRIVENLNSNKDTIKANLSNAQNSKIEVVPDFLNELSNFEKTPTSKSIDISNLEEIIKKYSA